MTRMFAAAVLAFTAGSALAEPAPAPSVPPAPSDVAAMPAAEQITAEAVKAVGGQEAIDKIKTMCALTTMGVQGMSLDTELCWSRSGGRQIRTTTPMGAMEVASDGKVAWMTGPSGSQLLTEDQARQINHQAGLFMMMLQPQQTLAQSKCTLSTTGRAPFDGKDCHIVAFKCEADGTEGRMFFDVASKLPAGTETVSKSPVGPVTTRMTFADWKPEQDVMFFRTATIETPSQPGMKSTLTVKAIQINAREEASFAAPPEIVRLATAPKSEPAKADQPAGEIKLEELTPQQQSAATTMIDTLKKPGDVNGLKKMIGQLESSLPPTAPERRMMQYIIQELKKEVAAKGG